MKGLMIWSSLAAVLGSSSLAHAVSVTLRPNEPASLGQTVEFVATAIGSGAITYKWDFGDGTKVETNVGTAAHQYQSPGHHPVIVIAKDATGVRSDSFLQTIHRPLPEAPPSSSPTIVFDPERHRVCNVNVDADSVSCVDTESLQLLFEVGVGKHPQTLAVAADGTLWITNQDDATLSLVAPSGTPSARVELPYASRPYGIVLNEKRGSAFVTLQATGELVEIDIETHALRRKVRVGPWPTGIARSGNGERLLVSRFISAADRGEVVEVDAATFTTLSTIPLVADGGPDTEATSRGIPNYLQSVVISPDDAFAWVPSKKDNTLRGAVRDGLPLTFENSVRTIVSQIDLAARAEVLAQRIDLNNRALGLSVTFSPLGDYAFVPLLGNNGIEVLDAYTGKIVSGLFELASAPNGAVLDDKGRLYLNAFLSRKVSVLDAASILRSTDFRLTWLTDIQVVAAEQLAADVLQGKRIFYNASDLRMSRDGYISCAACHLDGFEDGRAWDFTDRGEGLRNTSSLLSRRGVGQGPLHWTANFDEVQDFEHDIRKAFAGTGFMSEADFNSGSRNTTLGDRKAGISAELDALAAYVNSLDRVPNSPHRKSNGLLTEAGLRGRDLFVSSGCAQCHTGADFTDSASAIRHDVGTLTKESGGRLGSVLDGLDTPTLRGIWQTAPYLHDGSAATLYDVIGARNASDLHGRTSQLNEQQRDELVSYLMQIDNVPLNDEVVWNTTPDSRENAGCGCRSVQRAPSQPLSLLILGLVLCCARFLRTKSRLQQRLT